MTDFASLLQPDRGEPARLIHVVDKDTFTIWAKTQSPSRQAMLAAIRFDGKSVFQFAILPGKKDGEFDVITCVDQAGALAPWCLAKLGESSRGQIPYRQGRSGCRLGWMRRSTASLIHVRPARGSRPLSSDRRLPPSIPR